MGWHVRPRPIEFGDCRAVGRKGVEDVVIADPKDRRPKLHALGVAAIGVQLRRLKAQILEFDAAIKAWHHSNKRRRQLNGILGFAPALGRR